MKPGAFERIASADEIVGNGPFALSAAGRDVVVVRTAQGLRAFEGRCPHQGALLGEGEIDDNVLVCRNHRWRFSLDSGCREGGPERLISCPLVERDGGIFVDASGLPRAPSDAGTKRTLNDLPGPKGLPIIGNLHQLDPTKIHLVLERWAKQHGPVYRFRMGAARVVVIAEPKMADQVLRARPETFRRSAKGAAIVKELGVEGVFFAEGEAWRPQRKLSVAALSQRTVRELYPKVRMVTHRLKSRWRRLESAQPLEMVDELKRFTVDVTTLITFGHDANTIEHSDDVIQRQLEVILPSISKRLFAPVPTWRYIRLPADRRLERALIEVRAWLETLITDARARLSADPARAARPSNFLEAMLTARDDEGKPFSDELIYANLITMLLAGEDTTAFSLAWAIHLLCDHPKWALEIRKEADSLLGASDTADDLDQANKLVTAAAVANEAMRLRPVAPFILFDAKADTVVGDIRIEKGASVAVLTRPPAVDRDNFIDPDSFRPERWLVDIQGPHEVSAHIPFGSGPRMCPGRSLALVEMKTLLAMLCKNFDVVRDGAADDVREVFGFTMSPAGLRVRLTARGG
jgi:cytochrome P450/nitrite reductase/ring-hydroxylating ferredoxin subunit